MTTAAGTVAATDLDVRPRRPGAVARAVGDTLAITGRNLRAMLRVPQVIVFSTVQPIVFVLLFRYVFGGAISVPGIRYVDFLMPGIFVQTITFGAINTGVGLSADLATGMIERFRSLPMARSAVLAGRTFADLVRNAFVLVLMVVVGFLVGFRPGNGGLALLAGLGLVLLFAYALSWIFALVGLRARNPEAAQAIAFPLIAPLVFASSAFVRLDTMPGWLQAFARNQPVTQTIQAVRTLTLGGPVARPALRAVLWSAGLIAVFAPLAVRGFRRVGGETGGR